MKIDIKVELDADEFGTAEELVMTLRVERRRRRANTASLPLQGNAANVETPSPYRAAGLTASAIPEGDRQGLGADTSTLPRHVNAVDGELRSPHCTSVRTASTPEKKHRLKEGKQKHAGPGARGERRGLDANRASLPVHGNAVSVEFPSAHRASVRTAPTVPGVNAAGCFKTVNGRRRQTFGPPFGPPGDCPARPVTSRGEQQGLGADTTTLPVPGNASDVELPTLYCASVRTAPPVPGLESPGCWEVVDGQRRKAFCRHPDCPAGPDTSRGD